MSTQKKLLIGAAVAAAAVGGIMLTNYYLNKPSIEDQMHQAAKEIEQMMAPEIGKLETAIKEKQTLLKQIKAEQDNLTKELDQVNSEIADVDRIRKNSETSGL